MATIFDIGFHNGDDAAFYLSLGHRVLAVEANPALVEAGSHRFAEAVESGRLTILHFALWHTSGEVVPMYVNDSNAEWSSLLPIHGQRGGRYHVVAVPTITISELFLRYGVPYYLKIDIEGTDRDVVRGLPTECTPPAYLSCEVGGARDTLLVDDLRAVGYERFKLINQETLTASTEVRDDEFFYRLLRKAGTAYPPIRTAIARLPRFVRPAKESWDPPRDSRFSESTSGPFGEQAAGTWRSAKTIARRIEQVFKQQARHGRMQRYDLHAKHRHAAP